MPVELRVPAVGESITEVEIGPWLLREGQLAEKDQALVEIETDKATFQLPAPISGTISKVLKQQGQSAGVGEVIGYMEESAASAASPPRTPEAASAKPSPVGQVAGSDADRRRPAMPPVQVPAQPAAAETGATRIMPAARRALAWPSMA